jgi:hypothetical protein
VKHLEEKFAKARQIKNSKKLRKSACPSSDSNSGQEDSMRIFTHSDGRRRR